MHRSVDLEVFVAEATGLPGGCVESGPAEGGGSVLTKGPSGPTESNA